MSIPLSGPLLLAGAGRMGGAMLAGWIARGLDPRQVIVQDPAPPADVAVLLARHGIAPQAIVSSLPAPPAVLVMAVKPQAMEAVLPPLVRHVGPGTLVLSVAAGRTIASFERHLPAQAAVVRAMPNTPAAIGRGITVCCANAWVTAEQRRLCETLLTAVGEVAWAGSEDLLDAVTAVSGSGPAYVFLLAECLAEAAEAAGLEPGLAGRLANATVSGAGELLRQSGFAPATLRENVTSPNGTTFAALEVLMAADGLRPLLTKAVLAAAKRSRELAG